METPSTPRIQRPFAVGTLVKIVVASKLTGVRDAQYFSEGQHVYIEKRRDDTATV